MEPRPVIAFSALPSALRADRAFLALLVDHAADPTTTRWDLRWVALSELANLSASPESFLEARGDPEAAYDRVLAMAEEYARRGKAALSPIALAWHEASHSWRLLDGHHRLSAAAVAGLSALLAYTLLPGPADDVRSGLPRP